MDEAGAPALEFEQVSISYGGQGFALDAVSLRIAPGERHALLGPSGSGKTTLLRAAAGFEPVRAGRILLGGRVVDDGSRRGFIPPEDRGIGFVFQDYALFPERSVAQNVGFAWKRADPGRVRTLLAQVGLESFADRVPSELSGGQQQRVALARALAREPSLLLLDEPFSNIDKSLRRSLRESTLRLLDTSGVAAVFVTHDAEEAMAVGDRLTVLAEGRILQSGTALELYRAPRTLEVARTLGDVTLLAATAVDPGMVETALGRVAIDGGEGGTLLLRPEDLVVESPVADESANARLRTVRFLGPVCELILDAGGGSLTARCAAADAPVATGPARVHARRPGRLVPDPPPPGAC